MKSFYQVAFKHLVEEEKPGKKGDTVIVQKKKTGYILVRASSCAEAEKVANKMKSSLVDFSVERVNRTKIMSVTDGDSLNVEIDEE